MMPYAGKLQIPRDIIKEFKTHPQCHKSAVCECSKNGNKCQDRSCKNREMGVECSRCVVGCQNQQVRKGIGDAYLTKVKEGLLGYGVRARKSICRGQYVAEYLGIHKRRSQYEQEQRSNSARRLYSIKSVKGFVIDGSDIEVKAKYINESCSPNLFSLCIIVDQIPHVILVAMRHIEKGEFLSYTYKMKAIKNMKLYECECKKDSCKNKPLRKRRKAEEILKLFKCTACSRAYGHRRSLNRHNNHTGHGNSNKFTCYICKSSFRKRFELETHKESHKNMYPNVQLDNITNETTVKNNDMPQYVHTCLHCHKSFLSGKALYQHKAVHEPSKFSCHVCNSKFKRRKNLDLHMMRHEDTVKTFTCATCRRRFYRKSIFYKHIKRHSQTKMKFACQLCPMSFERQTHLDRHSATHKKRSKRKYVCQACNRKCPTQGLLLCHAQISHPGYRPFQCIRCKGNFSTKYGLKTHVRWFHCMNRPRCSKCDIQFYSKRTLLGHMDVHKEERKMYPCFIHIKGFKKCMKKYHHRYSLLRHLKYSH